MLKTLRRFQIATGAMAAVEFAFIAPMLVMLFFATIELSAAVDCRARVSDADSSAADLVAQSPSVTTADLANVYNASAAILYPNAMANAQLVLTSIADDGNGNNKVQWSRAYGTGATARVKNAVVTVPDGLIKAKSGQSVILAELRYNYLSPTAAVITGPLVMKNNFYSRPRRSATVICTNC
jgi:Flp pilus assembly protein TadG